MSNQTNIEFDLIFINDNYTGLSNHTYKYKNINYIELMSTKSVAENRLTGINYSKNSGYKVIIFADIDDYFEFNRVKVIKETLSDNKIDIIINDLNLVDIAGNIIQESYFSHRLHDNQFITFEDVKHSNIFGLSNTAARTRCFNNLNINPSIIAVDWHIFTSLLLDGAVAIFSNKTKTYYRQHTNNLAGMRSVSLETIKRSIVVKNNHYRNINSNRMDIKELNNYYDALYKKINDKEYINDYAEKCYKKISKYPFWWEEAIFNV